MARVTYYTPNTTTLSNTQGTHSDSLAKANSNTNYDIGSAYCVVKLYKVKNGTPTLLYTGTTSTYENTQVKQRHSSTWTYTPSTTHDLTGSNDYLRLVVEYHAIDDDFYEDQYSTLTFNGPIAPGTLQTSAITINFSFEHCDVAYFANTYACLGGGYTNLNPDFQTSSVPAAPGNLGYTNTFSPRKATITWSKSSGALYYQIYRGSSANPTTLLTSVGDVASYDDTDISPATTYHYRLKASADNSTWSDYSADLTVDTTITSTAISSATQITARKTDIVFAAAVDETHAEDISHWACNNGVTIVSATALSTTKIRLVHSLLTNGTTYTFTASDFNGDTDSTKTLVSGARTPHGMRLINAQSLDSKHTLLRFNFEPRDADLVSGSFTLPNGCTFTSATKQAGVSHVILKHSNLDNGTYTFGVTGLKNIFGDTIDASYDEKSVTVSIQHSTTDGLKTSGVYNGKRVGALPGLNARLAYVSSSTPTNLQVERSLDNSNWARVDTLWPSGCPGWQADTIYEAYDVIEESGKTFYAYTLNGTTSSTRGKSGSTKPTGFATATQNQQITDNNVVWRENTTVYKDTTVQEDGKYVTTIYDARPDQRTYRGLDGDTVYYRVVDNGTPSSSVSVTLVFDENYFASNVAYRNVYHWEQLDNNYMRPWGTNASLQDGPFSTSAYTLQWMLQFGHDYYVTEDPAYLDMIEWQLDYHEGLEYSPTYPFIYISALNNSTVSAGTYYPEHQSRESFMAYLGAMMLEKKNETTVSARMKDLIDRWWKGALDKMQRDTDYSLSPLGWISGVERTATISKNINETYTASTGAGTNNEWTPNQKLGIAILDYLLATDSNSQIYNNAQELDFVNDVCAGVKTANDAWTGEQVKALINGEKSTTYPTNFNYATYTQSLAAILVKLMGANAPQSLTDSLTEVRTWLSGLYDEWQPNTSYSQGDCVVPTTAHDYHAYEKHSEAFYFYKSNVGTVTSGANEPDWESIVATPSSTTTVIDQNKTITDGSITWKARLRPTDAIADASYVATWDGQQTAGAMINYILLIEELQEGNTKYYRVPFSEWGYDSGAYANLWYNVCYKTALFDDLTITLNTPTDVTSSGCTLTWTSYIPGGHTWTSYKVYRDTTNNFTPNDGTNLIATISDYVTNRDYTDTTADPSTTYYYKVKVTTDLDSLVSSQQTITTNEAYVSTFTPRVMWFY